MAEVTRENISEIDENGVVIGQEQIAQSPGVKEYTSLGNTALHNWTPSSLRYTKVNLHHRKFQTLPGTQANGQSPRAGPINWRPPSTTGNSNTTSEISQEQQLLYDHIKKLIGENHGPDSEIQPAGGNTRPNGGIAFQSQCLDDRLKLVQTEQSDTMERVFENIYSNCKPGYPPSNVHPDGHTICKQKHGGPLPSERDSHRNGRRWLSCTDVDDSGTLNSHRTRTSKCYISSRSGTTLFKNSQTGQRSSPLGSVPSVSDVNTGDSLRMVDTNTNPLGQGSAQSYAETDMAAGSHSGSPALQCSRAQSLLDLSRDGLPLETYPHRSSLTSLNYSLRTPSIVPRTPVLQVGCDGSTGSLRNKPTAYSNLSRPSSGPSKRTSPEGCDSKTSHIVRSGLCFNTTTQTDMTLCTVQACSTVDGTPRRRHTQHQEIQLTSMTSSRTLGAEEENQRDKCVQTSISADCNHSVDVCYDSTRYSCGSDRLLTSPFKSRLPPRRGCQDVLDTSVDIHRHTAGSNRLEDSYTSQDGGSSSSWGEAPRTDDVSYDVVDQSIHHGGEYSRSKAELNDRSLLCPGGFRSMISVADSRHDISDWNLYGKDVNTLQGCACSCCCSVGCLSLDNSLSRTHAPFEIVSDSVYSSLDTVYHHDCNSAPISGPHVCTRGLSRDAGEKVHNMSLTSGLGSDVSSLDSNWRSYSPDRARLRSTSCSRSEETAVHPADNAPSSLPKSVSTTYAWKKVVLVNPEDLRASRCGSDSDENNHERGPSCIQRKDLDKTFSQSKTREDHIKEDRNVWLSDVSIVNKDRADHFSLNGASPTGQQAPAPHISRCCTCSESLSLEHIEEELDTVFVVAGTSRSAREDVVAGTSRSAREDVVAGTSRSAREDVVAGTSRSAREDVVAGTSRSAKEDVVAGTSRSAREDVVAGTSRSARGDVVAGTSRSARGDVVAGTSRSARGDVVAGTSRSARDGVVAGTSRSAREDVVAGTSRSARGDVVAGTSRSAREDVVAGTSRSARDDVVAGTSRSAREDVVAGTSRSAREDVVAGTSRSARDGVVAGTSRSTRDGVVASNAGSPGSRRFDFFNGRDDTRRHEAPQTYLWLNDVDVSKENLEQTASQQRLVITNSIPSVKVPGHDIGSWRFQRNSPSNVERFLAPSLSNYDQNVVSSNAGITQSLQTACHSTFGANQPDPTTRHSTFGANQPDLMTRYSTSGANQPDLMTRYSTSGANQPDLMTRHSTSGANQPDPTTRRSTSGANQPDLTTCQRQSCLNYDQPKASSTNPHRKSALDDVSSLDTPLSCVVRGSLFESVEDVISQVSENLVKSAQRVVSLRRSSSSRASVDNSDSARPERNRRETDWTLVRALGYSQGIAHKSSRRSLDSDSLYRDFCMMRSSRHRPSFSADIMHGPAISNTVCDSNVTSSPAYQPVPSKRRTPPQPHARPPTAGPGPPARLPTAGPGPPALPPRKSKVNQQEVFVYASDILPNSRNLPGSSMDKNHMQVSGPSMDKSHMQVPAPSLEKSHMQVPGPSLEKSHMQVPGPSLDKSHMQVPGPSLEKSHMQVPGPSLEKSHMQVNHLGQHSEDVLVDNSKVNFKDLMSQWKNNTSSMSPRCHSGCTSPNISGTTDAKHSPESLPDTTISNKDYGMSAVTQNGLVNCVQTLPAESTSMLGYSKTISSHVLSETPAEAEASNSTGKYVNNVHRRFRERSSSHNDVLSDGRIHFQLSRLDKQHPAIVPDKTGLSISKWRLKKGGNEVSIRTSPRRDQQTTEKSAPCERGHLNSHLGIINLDSATELRNRFAPQPLTGHQTASGRSTSARNRSISITSLHPGTSSSPNNVGGSENTVFQGTKLGQGSWKSESVLAQSDVAGSSRLDPELTKQLDDRHSQDNLYRASTTTPVRPPRLSSHARRSMAQTLTTSAMYSSPRISKLTSVSLSALDSVLAATTSVPDQPRGTTRLDSVLAATTSVQDQPRGTTRLDSVLAATTSVQDQPRGTTRLDSVLAATTSVPDQPRGTTRLDSVLAATTSVPDQPRGTTRLDSVLAATTSVPDQPRGTTRLDSVLAATTSVPDQPRGTTRLDSVLAATTSVPDQPRGTTRLDSVLAATTSVPDQPRGTTRLDSVLAATTAVPDQPRGTTRQESYGRAPSLLPASLNDSNQVVAPYHSRANNLPSCIDTFRVSCESFQEGHLLQAQYSPQSRKVPHYSSNHGGSVITHDNHFTTSSSSHDSDNRFQHNDSLKDYGTSPPRYSPSDEILPDKATTTSNSTEYNYDIPLEDHGLPLRLQSASRTISRPRLDNIFGASFRRPSREELGCDQASRQHVGELGCDQASRQLVGELGCDQASRQHVGEPKVVDWELMEALCQDAIKKRISYMKDLFLEPADTTATLGTLGRHEKTPSSVHHRTREHVLGGSSHVTGRVKRITPPRRHHTPSSDTPSETQLRDDPTPNEEISKSASGSSTLSSHEGKLLELQDKIERLESEQASVQQQISDNNALGKQVCQMVDTKCKTYSEKVKIMAYIDDLDRIVRLLLNLSGQLARAENVVQALGSDVGAAVKKLALDKMERAHAKHQEARELKENMDRRHDQMMLMLEERLSEAELSDYKRFVAVKPRLAVELQGLVDEIHVGRQQVLALRSSLNGPGSL